MSTTSVDATSTWKTTENVKKKQIKQENKNKTKRKKTKLDAIFVVLYIFQQ